jgi:2-dehydropantoate 2-reductase
MKVCIYGAGAIGGFLGARLAATGRHEVSAVARGATLAALRAHGWRLRSADGDLQVPAHVDEDPAALGPQDLVVIAVKGPALADVARRIGPLLGPRTIVLPAMNGVPWWFCHGLAGPAAEAQLASVDPDGTIAANIPLAHVVGCVVHASTSTPEPGLVKHQMGRGLIIGEPDGRLSERVLMLKAVLDDAGFDVTASPRIQADLWYKLWGNLTTNPITAMTGATVDRLLADDLVRKFCTDAMQEAKDIGARLGCVVEQTPQQRHEITARLGAFRTSMLQDVDAGRGLELDSIVGAVRELGQRVGVPTPHVDTLFGLVRLFARVHGLYPEAR